jgi:arginyl-tRNA synthetase
MLIAYIQLKIPNLTIDTPLPVSLTELVDWYRAAKQRFDADAAFKQQAQKAVVALQQGDPFSLAVWTQICTISSQAYEEIYRLLSVELINRGESFYNPMLSAVVEDCKAAGLLKRSEGAQCLFLPGFVNREGEPLPLIIQKSDGGYNYATTDLAALKQRVQIEQADWIIYVTDAGQAQHFDMLFQAAKAIGYLPESVKVSHVSFGLVLRSDGKKFKTREGDTEKLLDLLMVAIDKAKDVLKSRNPELTGPLLDKTAKALGINAVKYADLSCHRASNYVFNYDKMLQFEGNTAAFLSYAVVRIRSIYRKADAEWSTLAKTECIQLVEPVEFSLALLLCQFEDVLDQTVRELMPHVLTDYLFRLAEKFHRFFHDCRVEGSAYQNSRLLLCGLVERVLCLGFELLGLQTLEKM